jgi:hypothetical protein
MLGENLDRWAQAQKEEGRIEGQTLALTIVLKAKFGAEIFRGVEDRLRNASEEQLNLWLTRVLGAETIDGVFAVN